MLCNANERATAGGYVLILHQAKQGFAALQEIGMEAVRGNWETMLSATGLVEQLHSEQRLPFDDSIDRHVMGAELDVTPCWVPNSSFGLLLLHDTSITNGLFDCGFRVVGIAW